MPVPLNAIAETIAKLQQENHVVSVGIAHQQEIVAKNEATIAALEPLAEWGPDPVEPTPVGV